MAQLADVTKCEAGDCSYNLDSKCWAPSVVVGEDHTECDTYTRSAAARMESQPGQIMSCDALSCGHNQDHSCAAMSVSLGMHEDHADCTTFVQS